MITIETLSTIISSNKLIVRRLGICQETTPSQFADHFARLTLEEKRDLLNAFCDLDRAVRTVKQTGVPV